MAPRSSYTDLEIRIFGRRDEGYPVEIDLDGGPEFPSGYLDSEFLPWVPTASPEEDGERLFNWLLTDDQLRTAWAQAVLS